MSAPSAGEDRAPFETRVSVIESLIRDNPEAFAIEFVSLGDRVRALEEAREALCDAIQWLVNRGPDKVPGEVMEKMKEWGS